MKIHKSTKQAFNKSVSLLAAILICGVVAVPAVAGDGEPNSFVAARADAGDQPAAPPKPPQPFFRTVTTDNIQPGSKELPWLGVGVQETTEPLAAQLGLKPGEGLVLNYIATNSPAAAAGLQKNDVLVELDGQMLVDAIQLRKLVQMHADGDSVKLEFYRTGKKQSATAKLSMRAFDEASIDGNLGSYDRRDQLFFMPKLPALPELDKGKLTIQVQQATDQARRAMEQAKRAVEEAMRQSLNGTDGLNRKLEIIQKKLGDLADGGVALRRDATVTVKNEGDSVRTIVKKDESGTYIIVAAPARHLTAHDANGKLLFDGPVESPEQQQKVPKEIWTKVQPMIEQLNQDSTDGEPSPKRPLEEK